MADAAASGMVQAVDTIVDIAMTLLTTVTSNPDLSVFFYAGLIGIGVGVIRKFKH